MGLILIMPWLILVCAASRELLARGLRIGRMAMSIPSFESSNELCVVSEFRLVMGNRSQSRVMRYIIYGPLFTCPQCFDYCERNASDCWGLYCGWNINLIWCLEIHFIAKLAKSNGSSPLHLIDYRIS